MHVLEAGGQRFQVLAGDVHLRGVDLVQHAGRIAGDPVVDVLAAGRGVVGLAATAVVLGQQQLVGAERIDLVLDLPVVVVHRQRQVVDRCPHNTCVPDVGGDRFQVRIAGAGAEHRDAVIRATGGVGRVVAQLAATVVVGGAVGIVAAAALECVGQGRRAEGSAVLAAEQQALDRAELDADAVGGLVDGVAADLEGVVAAGAGDCQRVMQRQTQLTGHRIVAAVAGTGDRRGAPDAAIHQARIGAVVPAFTATFNDHGQAGVAARQLEQ